MYRFKVYFTKTFTTGALEGLSVPDNTGFADYQSAALYAGNVGLEIKGAGANYVMSNARIVDTLLEQGPYHEPSQVDPTIH